MLSRIDQAWAKEAVGWPLRELAANIIRVVRGAGKSYEIAGQCVSVIEAFQQYRDKVGQWPSSWEIDQALSISRERQGQQTIRRSLAARTGSRHRYSRSTPGQRLSPSQPVLTIKKNVPYSFSWRTIRGSLPVGGEMTP